MASVGPPGWSEGTPGASARREAERRRANRERRVRERHPLLGGVILALQKAPQHERNWGAGGKSEERMAESLARKCGERVTWLYDRRIQRSRANIDMLAFAPSGVWVIDAKDYKGEVRIVRPRSGRPKLVIDGWNRSKLIDTLDWQVGLVREAVGALDPTVPVHGALCFGVRAELPLLRTLEVRGYLMGYPRPLARRLRAKGPLSTAYLERVRQRLAVEFPEA